MSAFGRLASVLLVAAMALSAGGQPSLNATAQRSEKLESPRDVVREVTENELHDRERDSHWEYRSDCTSPTQDLTREQIETDSGPIFRVLEEGGSPLDAARQEQENQRLEEYIHDPGQIARVERAHQEDEARLARVMALLPQAFLFTYDSAPTEDVVRLAFRPDPAFIPSGYEARIVHGLEGTLTVNLQLKRLIDMRGTVAERVDFGFGILGYVAQGGMFEIHRRQVSAAHWKTDLVAVHVEGKILMLKTVGKDEREARSDFHPVPSGTTLAEAREMLNQNNGAASKARLVRAAVSRK